MSYSNHFSFFPSQIISFFSFKGLSFEIRFLNDSSIGRVDFQEFCVFSECVRKFWCFKCTQDVVRQSATFHGTTELHPFSRAKQESTDHDEGKGS